jgi:hypothetical protein
VGTAPRCKPLSTAGHHVVIFAGRAEHAQPGPTVQLELELEECRGHSVTGSVGMEHICHPDLTVTASLEWAWAGIRGRPSGGETEWALGGAVASGNPHWATLGPSGSLGCCLHGQRRL